MDEGIPTLEAAFVIDTGNSFGELNSLSDLIGETAANAVLEFKRLENAWNGGLNLGGATAQISAFGNAYERDMQAAARSTRQVENATEAMIKRLARQSETFGMTASQAKAYRAEQQALAAESRGLTEASERLRATMAEYAAMEDAAAAAAAREAQALRAAANAHAAFEARVREGVTAMREHAAAESEAAREAQQLAAAAERLRASIDPSYAAQQRFNQEIGQAQLLISRGAITLDDYAAKLRMERALLDEASGAQGRAAVSVGAHRAAMQGLSFQAQDAFTQISMGANPLSVLAIQGGQAAGQMTMLGGRLGAVANFMIGPWGLAITGGLLLLGSLTKGLFESAEASKKVEFGSNALGDAQKILGSVLDLTTGKINTQNKALIALAQAQILVARVQAQTRAAEARRGVQAIQNREYQFDGGLGGGLFVRRRPLDARDTISQQVLAGTMDGSQAVKLLENLRKAGRLTDEQFSNTATSVANLALEMQNLAQYDAADRMLNGQGTASDRSTFLTKPKPTPSHDKGLSDAQKAYEAATKAAREYAATQIDEAAKVGMSAKQLRLYADAAAIAKAPTEQLKQAIRDAAGARETSFSDQAATDFQNNIMKPLKDELALYGLVGAKRAEAALDLEKEAFLAKNMDDGIAVATARWEEYSRVKKQLIAKDAAHDKEVEDAKRLADEMERVTGAAREAGDAIAHAFGNAGSAMADVLDIMVQYQKRQTDMGALAKKEGWDQAKIHKENGQLQIQTYGAMAGAAKGFFKEGTAGYKAMEGAERAFALVQLVNTGINVAAGAAKMFASLGPFAFPVVAAMIGVMAGLGFKGGGNSSAPSIPSAEEMQKTQGTGTVLGDANAQSESIKRAVEIVAANSDKNLGYADGMLKALRAIEEGIARLTGNVAKQIQVSGSMFDTAGLGLGSSGSSGFLGLFGSSTTRELWDLGLQINASTVGNIIKNGIEGQTYQIVQQVKKSSGFLGIGGGTKTSYQTTTGAIDADIQRSIVDVITSLRNGISSAADVIGMQGAKAILDSFQVNIGKVSLANLSGEEIEQQLTAIFSKVGDEMALAAIPELQQFQKVGEGAFETLARVASTITAVTSALDLLGTSAQQMSVAAKVGLADQFESVSDLSSAASSYFQTFYSKEEQAAARTAQMAKVFDGLGLSMPGTLASFRQLVEAQNLTTEAGRAAYATLLQLAPAFADLQSAMDGAKSAADIATERQDLQRQILELNGDTAALRALQLAKVDASNRALQQQVWAIQDAQAAAKAADELRKAWQSVGDSIMDEVKRIRGLSDTTGANTFAALQSQFNTATLSARGGDQDAAKLLPQLSQSLLSAAADAASSRQELDRIRAQTAASLEATYGVISVLAGTVAPASTASLLDAGAASQAATASTNDNTAGPRADQLDALRVELAQMHTDMTVALASIASAGNKTAGILDRAAGVTGGEAIGVTLVA